jgi:hypothetical protein
MRAAPSGILWPALVGEWMHTFAVFRAEALVAAAALFGLLGCQADVGCPSGNQSACGTRGVAGQTGGSPNEPTPAALGPANDARLWRLTRRQYDNVVRDLVGDQTAPGQSFTLDVGGHGFANSALQNGVKSQDAVQFQEAARRLARETVADPARLATLLSCSLAELEADMACAARFVESFGLRAYRRPLTAEEAATYAAFFQAVRGDSGAALAVQLVIETMLQSPHFLFRSELGDELAPATAGVRRLTTYETAAALSFYLWNSAPDEALYAAAADATLSTREGLTAQARRLMADPRVRPALHEFYSQFLELDELEHASRSAEVFPDYAAVRASLQGETQAFVEHVLFDQDASLSTLLTAPFTFVDQHTAPLYGLAAPATSGFLRVDLDPLQRAGVLTQPGFLSAHATPDASSPPRRGKFVLTRLLCSDLPAPPDNIPTPPNPSGEPETTRQFFERVTAGAECKGCHQLLHPLGFPFESYDQDGRYRTAQGALPIETSADVSVHGLGTVDGLPALARALVTSAQVRECLGHQTLRYAFGRANVPEDAATVAEMLAAFEATQSNLRELFLAVALAPAFVERNFTP